MKIIAEIAGPVVLCGWSFAAFIRTHETPEEGQ